MSQCYARLAAEDLVDAVREEGTALDGHGPMIAGTIRSAFGHASKPSEHGPTESGGKLVHL